MHLSIPGAAAIALALLSVGSCSTEEEEGTPTPTPTTTPEVGVQVDAAEPDDPGEPTPELEPGGECNPVVAWAAGTPVFVEATAAWGLAGVEGIRLSVTDFDGDGRPDLIARRGGGPDDFAPGGQRSRWLLRNTGDGMFEDVTQASELLAGRFHLDPDYGRPGEIIISGDVDNDGDLDVYVGTPVVDLSDPPHESSELMLNDGDGTFSLGPEGSAARLAGKLVVPAGATFTDFDRDGNLDLWIVQNMLGNAGSPLADKLLKGDGAGGFVEVTPQYGVSTQPWSAAAAVLNAGKGHTWGWSSRACDLNDDGIPELLGTSYGRAPNILWRGELTAEGKVTYHNESVASGYAFDHREDWTDNLSAQCYCWEFPEAEECDLPPAPPENVNCLAFKQAFGGNYRWNHAVDREPWRLGGNSAQTTCVDLNNDGHLDLLTGEIVHWDVGQSSDPAEIMRNLGDPMVRFDRPGNEETGLLRVDPEPTWDHGDMTNTVLDFDNDGWMDIYIGASDYPDNHGLLFRQTAPFQFERLETADYFQHNRSHGVVTADFDGDGDQDLVVGHSLMRCDGPKKTQCYPTQEIRLFENVIGQGGNWIQLRLVGGEGSNRAAIGARVTVTAGGITQTREVDGGGGHFGTQAELTVHVGLGAACEAEVTVVWPDADRTKQMHTLAGNARWLLTPGDVPSPNPW